LVTARTQRDTAVQALEKAIRHRELVHMTAPNDAIVLRLARLSVGSVLNAGDSLIELARLDSDMEAEIYVDPRDVGFIRPGDPVVIKLDPYNYVEHGWASGRVRWISEGTFSIMPTGTGGMLAPSATSTDATQSGTLAQNSLTSPFYKARIAITTADLKNVPPSFRLMPGMTLTADIHVGTRSLLTYLLKDIIRVFDEPMREP
jgi:HlyD family secretion protein